MIHVRNLKNTTHEHQPYLVYDSKYWQELSLLFDTLALSKHADCLALRLDMGGELLARLVVSGTILSLSGVL